jgi:hypothetical protein
VLFITNSGQNRPQSEPFLTYIAAGGAVFVIAASIFVPRFFASPVERSFSGDSKSLSVRPLAATYQTLLIIRCALLEGAAFFSLVAYMIERQPIAIGAAVVLLVALLANFPTASRLEAWIEAKLAY